MTPEDALLAAADDMSKHGLAKEKFYTRHDGWETAPACALGSLSRAMGRTGENGLVDPQIVDTSVAKKLADTIRDRLSVHDLLRECNAYEVITHYNDRASTSTEDMILAFKEAAHRED